MAKGHFVSGLAAGLLSSPLAVALAPAGTESPARSLALAGAFTALVGVGALWPDIDHKPALISKIVPGLSQLTCWIMRALSEATYQATRTDRDRPTGCHRTLTHTVPFVFLTGAGLAAVLLVTPAAPWAWFVGIALGLGTATHIFGDSLTLSGVPVRWPLLDRKGRRWATYGAPRWMRFRAGGPVGEKVATLGFAGLAAGVGALVLAADGAPWWMPVLALLGGR